MREFETAAASVEVTPDGVESGDTFPIIERDAAGEIVHTQIVRYYKPGDGQTAVLVAGTGRHADTSRKISTILNFLESVVDADSSTYLTNRLLNRNDPFGVEEAMTMLNEMMEEWGGRPTQPSRVSTPSQTTGGQNSAGTTPALISSGSRLTGS